MAPEALGALGSTAPFTLDPTLLKLEVGCYVSPIILGALADLLVGIWTGGTRGSNGGISRKGGVMGIIGNNPGASGVGGYVCVFTLTVIPTQTT